MTPAGDTHTADKTIRIRESVRDRLNDHRPDATTHTGTIHRAVDALERQRAMPAAVRAHLPTLDGAHTTCPECGESFDSETGRNHHQATAHGTSRDMVSFGIAPPAYDRLVAVKDDAATVSGAIDRALDALEAADDVPAVVREVYGNED
jgi:hypothetical protein